MPTQRRSATRRPGSGPRRSPPRRVAAQPAGATAVAPPRPRFTGRALVLALVMLALVISYASSLRAWWQQHAEISAAQADIVSSQRSVDILTLDKHRWADPAYVQQQARERFGWVLPGEVGYRVVDAGGHTLGAPARPAAPPQASTPPSWYEQVWGSIRAAGEEPGTTPPKRTPPRQVVIKLPRGRGSRGR